MSVQKRPPYGLLILFWLLAASVTAATSSVAVRWYVIWNEIFNHASF